MRTVDIITVMIGDIVKALREARGWNQAELSRRAGLRSQQINQLESGKKGNPTQKTLEALAHAFEMPVSEFMRALGVGGDAPPDAMREMIIEAEFKELTEIWPRLSPAFRLALVAAARSMAQSAQAARDSADAGEQPVEYISHAP